jgi:hypothetical protein
VVITEEPMSRRFLAFLVLLNLIFIVAFLVTRVDQVTNNVYTLKLVGGCYVDYYAPIQAVELACPGVDHIRPWPMVQPWPDPTDWPEGARMVCQEAGK